MIVHGTSVGLDVHARSVVAHGIDEDRGTIVRATLSPNYREIIDWLLKLAAPVRVVYEAGPTGFGLVRAIRAAGIECVVAAPSLLQRPVGDRVKTDARDAAHLAKLLRLGEIVEVVVPDPLDEAARSLVRARDQVRGDLMRSRNRTSKFLLSQGHVYYGGTTWTGVHDRWMRGLTFGHPALRQTFESNYAAMAAVLDRRDRLDEQIAQLAEEPRWAPTVIRLQCLRGVSLLTAFGLAVEFGDWQRFTGSSIGAYVGMVPSEYSSGDSRSQGSITKTGNSHARRLLVEAAWVHRRPYNTPGTRLRERWARAGAAAQARGHAGNRRLHSRWQKFDERKKNSNTANVAIARELAGWCWSLAVMD